jgi:DNA-binding NarL/FixJ family response regulator
VQVVDGGREGQAILVGDVDLEFRRLVTRALAATGVPVVQTATGRETLTAAAQNDVVAVVLDVRLDDPSGYEVCRRLREDHGDALPIIFVSGDRTEPFDRVAGLLLGADDYLVKPVAPDELVARVRRHLRRQETHDAAGVRLTARERQILRLLAEGFGPTQIGRALGISPKTVATHVEHIYAKLGVHTRAQAVASAFRLALVEA